MSAVDQRPSPVQRQLETYEQSWQREHREAMVYRGLEDTIAMGWSTGTAPPLNGSLAAFFPADSALTGNATRL
jgi:hypothetical protein